MRTTSAGTAVAVAAPLVAGVGLLLGVPELVLLAVAALSLLLVAAAMVGLAPLQLRVGRDPRPRRVAVGDRCEVLLRVRNAGTRRTPVVRVVDEVGSHGRVTLSVAPVAPGHEVDTAYRLPTHRRGEERLGPLTVVREDPLGLVRRTLVLPGTTTVLVRPQVVPLERPGPVADTHADGDRRLRVPVPSADEDLAGLRPYEPGDDVRRVHWRTTARTGVPVVRHHDAPQRRRTTLLVDVRAAAHDGSSFERAMSAAASVAAAVDPDDELRVVTTDGVDTGAQRAGGVLDEVLDLLARAAPSTTASLPRTLTALGARGRLVVVAGVLGADETVAVLGATTDAADRTFVACGSAAPGPIGASGLVVWDGQQDPGPSWHRACGLPTGRRTP